MLEQINTNSVEDGLKRLSVYGLRRKADFDKYHALTLAEDVMHSAKEFNHERASSLRDKLDSSDDDFRAYFMALFGDKDFQKVYECLAKVDKARNIQSTPTASTSHPTVDTSASHPGPMVCYFCGIPGHIAPFCYKKKYSRGRGRGRGGGRGRARFSPYTPFRGEQEDSNSQ